MADFEVRLDEFAMWVVRQRRTLSPVSRHVRRQDAVRAAERCAARTGGGRVRTVLADGRHAVRRIDADAPGSSLERAPRMAVDLRLVDPHTGELLRAPELPAT